jgi:hypothetical protein
MNNKEANHLRFDDISISEDDNEVRMYKSQLFQTAKKAQEIFDYLGNGAKMEDWMKNTVASALEGLSKVCQNMEFEIAYPSEVEDPPGEPQDEKEGNNYLSNEDKRYPVPQSSESGDLFMGRCIADPNMKNRYSEQSDRFLACMLILQNPPENVADNPGEKFDDPMAIKEVLIEPEKPILP